MTTLRHRAAGIYVISNGITGAKYFGSALRVGVRRQRHFYDLRAGSHMNPHLQAAWDKYGAEAFSFVVLAYLEKSDLLPTEQRLIDAHYGREDCYNVSPVAGAPMAGRKHSKETKARMSAHFKGKPKSAATRARMSKAQKQRGMDPRTLAAAWAATRGVKQSPERVEHRAALLRGRKHSAERVAQRIATRRANKLGAV